MAVDRKTVEWFRNRSTGHVWAANPGTPEYKRMVKGVTAGEFERVDSPKTKKAPAKKQATAPGTDGE